MQLKKLGDGGRYMLYVSHAKSGLRLYDVGSVDPNLEIALIC